MSKATLLAKADGVLAGQALANQIMAAVDPDLTVSWSKTDGDLIAKGELFCEMNGKAHSILRAERVLLNFMQRMSGKGGGGPGVGMGIHVSRFDMV